jgi:hypothetical protein
VGAVRANQSGAGIIDVTVIDGLVRRAPVFKRPRPGGGAVGEERPGEESLVWH